VLVKLWSDFLRHAKDIHAERPSHCRYTMTYKPGDATMTVTLTNDSKSVRIRSCRSSDLSRAHRVGHIISRTLIGGAADVVDFEREVTDFLAEEAESGRRRIVRANSAKPSGRTAPSTKAAKLKTKSKSHH